MKVTTDDLLDALRSALAAPPDGEGVTASEIVAATGRHIGLVRKMLHGLNAEGRLEVVRVRRTDLSGRTQLQPGYRMKKGKRAA